MAEPFDFYPYQRLAAAVIEAAFHDIKSGWIGPRTDPVDKQPVKVREALEFICGQGAEYGPNPHVYHEACSMEFLFDMTQAEILERLFNHKLTFNAGKNQNPTVSRWRASRGLPSSKKTRYLTKTQKSYGPKEPYKMESYSK